MNIKFKIKKVLKTVAIISASVICITSFSACSFLNALIPTPSPSAETSVSSSPEEAIIGSWKIESFSDKDGNEISVADIDFSGTQFANMSSIISMILKQGAVLEFKSDKTVSFSMLSGNYEISDESLILSISQISDSISLPCEISGNEMHININGYMINLSKQ